MQPRSKSAESSTDHHQRNPSLGIGALLSLNCLSYTCSYCFKAFPSSQALGGHQNAHRRERMAEKRLYIMDPLTYRKRAFLDHQSVRPPLNAVVPHGMRKGPSRVQPLAFQYRAACGNYRYGHRYHHLKPVINWKPTTQPIDLNLLPESHELITGEGGGTLVEKGYEANLSAAKARDFNGIKSQRALDLTLKL